MSELQIKIGKQRSTIQDVGLIKLINEASELNAQQKEINERLSALKKDIAEKAREHLPEDTETITFISDGLECRLQFGNTYSIDQKYVPVLKEHLKGSFDTWMETRTTYRPKTNMLSNFEVLAKSIPDLPGVVKKPRSPHLKFSVKEETGVFESLHEPKKGNRNVSGGIR